MTNTLTLSVSFGSSVTVTLNEKSAEGYDCVSLTVPSKSKKAELIFAPRAAGSLPYIYRMLEMDSDLFQPEGWDFAFGDGRYVYVRRPLPRLCHADYKAFPDEQEITFLSEKAAEGYFLAGVVMGKQYLFVPHPEGEAITYRIDYGPETQDGACYALPEQDDSDGDGMYFLCANENISPVKYYFANVPLSTEGMPPCGDVSVPPELWEDRVYKHSLRKQLPTWAAIATAFLITMAVPDGFSEWWVFLLTLVACALTAIGCPIAFARGERRIVRQHLKENGGQVPRVSRSALNATRPTTGEMLSSTATYLSKKEQKKTLWSTILLLLVVGLIFSLLAFFGIPVGIGTLISDGFSVEWLMDGFPWLFVGILSAPLAVVIAIAVFKTIKNVCAVRKKK